MKRYVLITGASSGIGKDCALYLAKEGFHIFAGVRNKADFQALSNIHKNLEPLYIDVLELASIQKSFGQIHAIVGPNDAFALFNNAGTVQAGPLEHIPCEDFSRQLEVNVTAQVRTTQAFLTLLRAVAEARIIFTGSMSGFFVSPIIGPYCASKHALEAVSDAFRRELSINSNIKVSLLQPGQIVTPIWKKSLDLADDIKANIPNSGLKHYQKLLGKVLLRAEDASINGSSTREVAKCVHHALVSSRPKTRYRMGKGARSTYFLQRLLSDKLIDSLIRKAFKL